MKNLLLTAVSMLSIFSCLPLGADAQAIMPRTSAFDRFNGIVGSISDLWAGTSVNHTISLNSGDSKLVRKPSTFVFGHQWRMANRSTPSTFCSAGFTGLVSWGWSPDSFTIRAAFVARSFQAPFQHRLSNTAFPTQAIAREIYTWYAHLLGEGLARDTICVAIRNS